MKIQELRELIKDKPDDMTILTPTFDHSYQTVDCYETTAAYNLSEQQWSEAWNKEQLRKGDILVDVLVVS